MITLSLFLMVLISSCMLSKSLRDLFKRQFVKVAFALLFIFTTSVMTVSADILKLKSTEFAYMECDKNGDWTDWTDWIDSNLLIVIDEDADSITIYSDPVQELDIYGEEESVEDDDNNWSYTFNCVDTDGIRCQLRLVCEDGDMQIYIDYSDLILVYNVVAK